MKHPLRKLDAPIHAALNSKGAFHLYKEEHPHFIYKSVHFRSFYLKEKKDELILHNKTNLMKNINLQKNKFVSRLFKACILAGALTTQVSAQCISTNNNPTGTISISPIVQTVLSTNMNCNDYAVTNFSAPGQYQVDASFGTFITVTDNSNTPLASGTNPLVVTIPTAGLYRVHIQGTSSCFPSGGSRIIAVSPQNRAFNFDGNDDLIDLGTAITTSLTGSTHITAEAWVYPTSMSGLGCVIGNYSTISANMQFLMRRGGGVYEFWVGNGSTWEQVISAASPSLNVWQHVAGVWDGTTASIYVNGVLSGTLATTIGSLGNAGSNEVWIGANAIAENFAGNIDEVRIWNRALCQGEIQNNMNGLIATTGNSLIANYHFDEGTAGGSNSMVTSLFDLGGSAYTGTVTNAALTGMTSNWVASSVFSSCLAAPVYSAPAISVSGPTVVCPGKSATLTASGVSTYTWTSGPMTSTYVVTPTTTATYSVVGTATDGCVSNMATASVSLTTNPSVTAVTSATNYICVGQTATLTAGGAATYTWMPAGSGASITVTPTISTTYTVTGTNTLGCTAMAMITQSVSTCTGIESQSAEANAFLVYPNPGAGIFYVETTSPAHIELYDVLGKQVLSTSFEAGKFSLTLTDREKGLYMLKVIQNNTARTIRLINQ